MIAALWTTLKGWFAGVPWGLVGLLAIPAATAGVGFGVYKAGQASARAAEMQALAADNAAAAARYQQQVVEAEDAIARERARADALAIANAQLKDQVAAVARGAASPGVDRAVHGLQSPGAAPAVHGLPGPPRGAGLSK